MRTRPAMIIIKMVTTLQMTKTMFTRLAMDTLSELIVIVITRMILDRYIVSFRKNEFAYV